MTDTAHKKPESAEGESKPVVAYDLIAVGNTKIDMFFSFYQDSTKWRVTPRTNELALKLGEKIAVDRSDYSMGGNANNVSVGLSRLGYSVALMAEIGDDAFADDIEKNLRAEGVSNALVVRTPGSRTSIGVIMNVDGDRTLLSQHMARSHPFSFDGVATRLLYLTSIGNAWEHVYQKTVDFALANKVPIAFNPGTIQLREQSEAFWKVIKHTHILCVNREEAIKILTGAHSKLLKRKEPSIEDMMAELAELGPKIVIVTDGKEGSHARAEDGRVFHQETIPAVVVERTGAGDGFMAGVLGAALNGKSLQEAMLWGTRNAAAVVGKIGAQEGLLTREQMESNIMDMRLIDLGYSEPLIILPFDHRAAFAKYMFEADATKLKADQVAAVKDFKAVIYEAVKKSLDLGVPRGSEAILVDEETGTEVLKDAAEGDMTTILSVEKGGAKEFAFQYGAQYHQHIDKFKPTFTKAMVYYNTADTDELKKRQQAKLKEISDYSHERGYKFLLEVLVKPTGKQVEDAGGSQDDFDKNLKAAIMVDLIGELQAAGVEPDVWKLEGLDSVEDYQNVVKAIRAKGRDKVGLVVLGRGASKEKVESWLELGAGLPGIIGFSVGRTVFWDALSEYYHKKASRAETVSVIAKNFAHFYEVFSQKESSVNSAVLPSSPETEQLLATKEVVGDEDPGFVVNDPLDSLENSQINHSFAVEAVAEEAAKPATVPSLAEELWMGGSKNEEDGAMLADSSATVKSEVGGVEVEEVEAAEPAVKSEVKGEVKSEVEAADKETTPAVDDEDDDLPIWAVSRQQAVKSEAVVPVSPYGEPEEGVSSPAPVVGGFSIEPSFEVPEDPDKDGGEKKGLKRFFSKKK